MSAPEAPAGAPCPPPPPPSILIKGGKCVNADEEFFADVLILGSKIVKIEPNIDEKDAPYGCRIINAKGKYVMPGGIDTHTHMELSFMGEVSVDDFFAGSRACLAGGTTMFIDFIIPSKGQSLVACYHDWRKRADAKVMCDYGLHIAVTYWADNIEPEMTELAKLGVQSCKVFMAYKGAFMINDAEMFEVFKVCKKLGMMALVHAENGDAIVEGQKAMIAKGITGPEGHCMSRPEEVEAEATYRALMIGGRVNLPTYIVHVMSKLACDAVVRARKEGICTAYGEPIAAGLGVDGTHCWAHDWRHAAAYVMGPPLRPDPTTKKYLMHHLATGDLQCVGTDNCTFNAESKALGKDDFRKCPNGVNGCQDRMSVVWNNGVCEGIITPCQFVAVTSTNAAKLFGCYPRKGVLRVGADADVVVWDPDTVREVSAKTHMHACDFNIFEGMKLRGVADVTITRGNVAWENGKPNTWLRGHGKFVPRDLFGPAYYGIAERDAARMRNEVAVERKPYDGPVAGQKKKE